MVYKLIEENYKNLVDKFEKEKEIYNKIKEVDELLKINNVNDTSELISRYVDYLSDLSLQVKSAYEDVLKFRMSCNHNLKYYGHDGHKDCYVCTICGEEIWQ